jgi:type II secretory pathway pseudopilin PulG
VIIIIGIVASIATSRLGETIQTARYEHTMKELDQLAYAIGGNPGLTTDGRRTDFGYVGDVGALPPTLDALVSNPGGLATWNGPYIETGASNADFKTDAWNSLYTYAAVTIRSSGSGTNIDKLIVADAAWLTANTLEGFIVDADYTAPGAVFCDSLLLRLTYPNGTGGMATASSTPGADGGFSFSGLPIGTHTLQLIFQPDTDTTLYEVTIEPGRTSRVSLSLAADMW